MKHKRPKDYGRKAPGPAKRPVGPLLLIAGGVLLLGLTALLAWRNATATSAPEVAGAPALKVDREKVDLGDVKLGHTVEVSFEVANVGDRTLMFKQSPYVEVVEGC